MPITDEKKESARRTGIFERHVAECDICAMKEDRDGGVSVDFCMSGRIMAGFMVAAIQRAAKVRP